MQRRAFDSWISWAPRNICAGSVVRMKSTVRALIDERRAALVVAEYLVVQVEAGDDSAKALPETIADLRINLEVGESEDVAGGTLGAEAAGVRAGDERG